MEANMHKRIEYQYDTDLGNSAKSPRNIIDAFMLTGMAIMPLSKLIASDHSKFSPHLQ